MPADSTPAHSTPGSAVPSMLPPGVRHLHSGKVRELFELPDGRILMVASNRISAYDHVLEPAIPDKGRVLTALSLWWFDRLADLVPHHVVATELPAGFPADYANRAVVCERLAMIDVECVARGYLAGSGWSEYQRSQTVCGIALPPGLENGSRLPEPIFTPTTKAPHGEHDQPLSYDEVVDQVGPELADRLRRITLEVYRRGHEIAVERGVIIADTKIELGTNVAGELVLADEVLTPDSSRFWPADQWRPGRSQPSFDKQYVRDWLTSEASGWSPETNQPPPPLPADVVAETRATYLRAYELITGQRFDGTDGPG